MSLQQFNNFYLEQNLLADLKEGQNIGHGNFLEEQEKLSRLEVAMDVDPPKV